MRLTTLSLIEFPPMQVGDDRAQLPHLYDHGDQNDKREDYFHVYFFLEGGRGEALLLASESKHPSGA